MNKIDVLLSITNRNAKKFNKFLRQFLFYVKNDIIYRQFNKNIKFGIIYDRATRMLPYIQLVLTFGC